MAYVISGYVGSGYAADDIGGSGGGLYVISGYVGNGYAASAGVGVGGPLVLVQLLFAGPGIGGATPVGTPTLATIVDAPRLYPDIIFALHTLAGLRLFGERMIPDEIAATDLGRYSNLLDISDLSLRSVPIGNDLVQSLGSSEQGTFWVDFDNTDKFWSRLVMREPLLCAAAGAFLWYGGTHLYLVYRGEVSRVLLRRSVCRLEISQP